MTPNEFELEKRYELPNLHQIDCLIGAIGTKTLEEVYEITTTKLYLRNRMANIKTHSEIRLAAQIRRETKLSVQQSVWIGGVCVDFFIPGIGGKMENGQRKMKGLVIEVNGKVHDFEPKMKKDELRLEILGRLGIGILVIENLEIGSWQINKLISELKKMPRLSSRAKRKFIDRVRSYTVIANNTLFLGGKHGRV